MNFIMGLIITFVSLILLSLFFIISTKTKWETFEFQAFECGFGSYFFSRFSFSIQYFLVALIFLFLDLEICLLIPMMSEICQSVTLYIPICLIVLFLLLGLVEEWHIGKLDWME